MIVKAVLLTIRILVWVQQMEKLAKPNLIVDLKV